MPAARLMSLQVGAPKTLAVDTRNQPVISGIFKEPVDGPVWLGWNGLSGDTHVDRQSHGGADKAVLGYGAAHYDLWRDELGLLELKPGVFGENFTIDGLTEQDVCVGDVCAIGSVEIQVSQPRQPCWKLSVRFELADMAERVIATNRAGWYYRVLTEGYVEAGAELALVSRPFPQWTIAKVNDVIFGRIDNATMRRDLSRCHLLASSWRAFLRRRA
jgi:MOSC domain-containing protein YiiM